MKVEYKIKKNVSANETVKSGILYTKTHVNKLDSGKAVERSVVKGTLVQKFRSSHGDNPRTREYKQTRSPHATRKPQSSSSGEIAEI